MALRGKAKRAIQKGVDNREAFKVGNVRGVWFNDVRNVPRGRLSYELLQLDDPTGPVFAVFSYATPIAWMHAGQWTVSPEKYSVTTTNHQNVVRLAIEVPGFYADARW